ncbi:MAG: APC family permease, partial [Thermodesulfobacteriota bacterium]|nr:APC family permease [Thermodesulfobacteriota bacterium]
YRGGALSGIFQSITVVVLLCASVFFVFSGVTLGSVENARPLINNLAGISMVMLMVPSFMAGFNAIAQATEETNVAPRTIGKLIIITVWACVIFYIMIILGLSFAAPESIRGSGGVVVLDAMKNLFNSSTPRLFVAIAALIGMLTSWNAAYLVGSRLLFALGRVGFLPESFSHLSSRHGTPSNAIIAVFVISSLCTIMGTSQGVYVGIIDVLGFCIVVIWFMVSLSFLRLRRTRPEMNRPYKIPAGGFIGGMATILSIVCLLLYTPINPLGGLNTGELIGLGVLASAGIALYYRYIIKGALDEEQRRNILNKSI